MHITVNALRVHEVEQKKERLLIGPDYEDNGLVLPRYDGTIWKPDLFTAAFRRFTKDVGLGHFRFHDLRHSHATQLLKAGIHPKIVSERRCRKMPQTGSMKRWKQPFKNGVRNKCLQMVCKLMVTTFEQRNICTVSD